MNEVDYQEEAELDPFSQNAKSSVKLKKNHKGVVTWEIKVVTGEKDLISGLMEVAVKAHKELESKLEYIYEKE